MCASFDSRVVVSSSEVIITQNCDTIYALNEVEITEMFFSSMRDTNDSLEGRDVLHCSAKLAPKLFEHQKPDIIHFFQLVAGFDEKTSF